MSVDGFIRLNEEIQIAITDVALVSLLPRARISLIMKVLMGYSRKKKTGTGVKDITFLN